MLIKRNENLCFHNCNMAYSLYPITCCYNITITNTYCTYNAILNCCYSIIS